MPQIRVGDVVQLKSGGPEMTVSFILPTGRCSVCGSIGPKKRGDLPA